MTPVWISWSGGKDSALALLKCMQSPDLEVQGLITSYEKNSGVVPFQSIQIEHIQQQAAALNLNLRLIPLPEKAKNSVYEASWETLISKLRVQHLVFGDLFLEDIRSYREKVFGSMGVQLRFPNWSTDSRKVAEEILQAPFEAIISMVDPKKLDAHWIGKPYDTTFIRSLTPGIDPCGENGEFHTRVHFSPSFPRI